MAFNSSLSGMRAANADLNVTSHNIANVNTTGFKESRAEFAEVFSSTGYGLLRNGIGAGVRLTNVAQQFSQGDINQTGRYLDMAVDKEGFFTVSNNGTNVYTRAGNFQRDPNGYVTTPEGYRLQVFPPRADGIGFDTGNLTDLRLLTTDSPPSPTTRVELGVTLPGNAAQPTIAPFSPTDSASYNETTSVTVYDSLGNKQQLTAYFGRSVVAGPPVAPAPTNAFGGNDWSMNVTDSAGNVLQTVTMSFDADGKLRAPAAGAMPNITLPASNGAAALTAQLNLTGTTQLGADNDPKKIVQNGYTSGALVGFSVQEDGTILGSYSNEQTMSLGQIAMASFGNVEGLKPEGDNVWSATGASGQELLGVAGGAMGTLKSNAVEESNVDLSGQLVNLIVAQRNYQANAQTIKAQDTVLQTLVNI